MLPEHIDDFPTQESSPGGPKEGSTEGELDLEALFASESDREVVRWLAAVREEEGK